MPAKKKDPSTRARRNKATTAATLRAKPLEAGADYSALTVALLKDEIDRRNEGRRDEELLSKRGSKASLVAALTDDDDDTPELPERWVNDPELGRHIVPWSKQTLAWWADVWASPMSNEWHESDVHNLYVCALLYDDMWSADTATARQKAAAEFRQQRAVLGLTPYDRRRLEWTIEGAEEAKDRGKQRRTAGQPKPPAAQQQPGGRKDPRAGLSAVS